MIGPRRRRLPVVVAAMLATACGAAGDHEEGGSSGVPSAELTVFAAVSLTDAFEDVRTAFVAQHSGVNVVVNYAGSQTLASQIIEGAPADVFASADAAQMDRVVAEGRVSGRPEIFASNVLAIAVAPGNPLGIQGLDDLADPALLVVLPAEEVPAGRYSRSALEVAGVAVQPVSLEPSVRAALSKVELGEADASIVYASDVVAADAVTGVPIPAAQNVAAQYPVAVLNHAPNPAIAAEFVAYVRSDAGQHVLATHGFVAP